MAGLVALCQGKRMINMVDLEESTEFILAPYWGLSTGSTSIASVRCNGRRLPCAKTSQSHHHDLQYARSR